ncbi:16S rRNA (uracil(1498)-N(3))-methyltransferase [Oceanobacillus bengalensis]|uniref:Ribosomal RNA small subunit methyltransferase E n=1 Tax=Oceanobacillus bengalensis TaxID=1435466 RepID=A0A494Z5P2_9BACI|nr:16S rRNA (uracil(1498)-N(3))-methyltransferase [Oceanobacillus bengalensis]RKQ17858.1 16S rRNA (uracil(1498)-N(3))-methyltransferase [Oceanobacillus bengalensis]
MQRYFIPTDAWSELNVTIQGEDVHHMIKVMRFKVGDKIICNNDQSNAALCEIVDIQATKVEAKILDWLDETVELPVQVTIAQGIPKGDKFDYVLQKGTELGAAKFIPFKSDRSVVVWDNKKVDKKLIRFKKIVKEASEQSHRNQIPEVLSPMDLRDLIQFSSSYDIRIFAYEEEAKTDYYQSFGEVLNNTNKNDSLLIIIGPEGGFSNSEAEQLKQNAFHPVRLGPRILRTETAAIYALASISYHFEESITSSDV